MIETIINTKNFNKLWDKYSKEDTFREMYVDLYNNLIQGYVEDIVFKEFRFKKKMKDEILSDIRYTVYELSKDDINNLNLIELCNRLEKIIRTSCEENQLLNSRIDTIMKKLSKSVHPVSENEMITMIKVVFMCRYMSEYDDNEI